MWASASAKRRLKTFHESKTRNDVPRQDSDELIRKRIAENRRREEDTGAEEREYQQYLREVKKTVPEKDIWKYTIGDKVNTLQNVREDARKRVLCNRYRRDDTFS